MPLNPDEAANDEWKTYNDEGFGRDEGHDLNDIKGDLVNEDDEDEIRQPYQVSELHFSFWIGLLYSIKYKSIAYQFNLNAIILYCHIFPIEFRIKLKICMIVY